MGRLVVTTSLSLDGVMQSPGIPDEDTSGGFELGGWLVPHFDESLAALEQSGALLIGRRTYDIFAAFWPKVPDDDPIGKIMNNTQKYVVSTTLRDPHWQNTTVLSGDVVAEITDLKQREGEIHVPGSGNLIQTLLANDLVDEFRLTHFPVLLGSGKKLFADGTHPAGLKLVNTMITKTGVIAATYVRDGDVKIGSFALEQG
ncbi:dihydrofolate reductase [Actinokineospora baliensis]|uniref:dihydrofolate reductase family protein n=1 Tax=Actinokineospora baliensis TaxID=547056 RepID=UPI0019589A1B|nr:dihydrofolate reductase family protein [Actinokineospora baliensis]MBM7774558.1 dihydrofolate reductase [Actinokineospora baliensis]